jgi:hypothetical protein
MAAIFEAFGVCQRVSLFDHRFFLTGASSQQKTKGGYYHCNCGSDVHVFLLMSLRWLGLNQWTKPEAHAWMPFLCSGTNTLSTRTPDAVSKSSMMAGWLPMRDLTTTWFPESMKPHRSMFGFSQCMTLICFPFLYISSLSGTDRAA